MRKQLKGYFFQSQSIFPPTDCALTKGTNVNTIPEMSKLNSNTKKSNKINENIKKANQINQLSQFQKQESGGPIIIPIADSNVDDQSKNDTKKKKRNKKDRPKEKKVT